MSDLFLKVHDQLPVYSIECNDCLILYTPGSFLKIKAVPIHELINSFKNPGKIENPILRNAVEGIMKQAREAVYKWEQRMLMQFSPECLTIHVGSDCNFNCSYCYSKAGGSGNKRMTGFPDQDSIKTLISYIIERRRNNSGRFAVVFHGSGEPTFHWQKMVNSFHDISTIAKMNELPIFTFIATNGCLTEDQTDWLAEKLDLIGISCDGPDTIQQKQRKPVYQQYLPIEKVCERILEKGGEFENRVTITRDTISQLLEITTYLTKECKTKKIRIEPVFLAGENGFTEKEADKFFTRFIEARNFAEQNGVSFSYAGIRIEEQHGTYCDVLRNTLRLTVDNVTRNCFCFMNEKSDFITGRLSMDRSVFHLSPEIQELKKKAFLIPDVCNDCINVFHCSRGCPDFCIFDDVHFVTQNLNPFRCRLHKLLAVERIKDIAVNQNTHFDEI